MKKISFKKIWIIFKEAGTDWWAKDPFRESATIAYYAFFSFPALLAIVIAIAAFFFGQEAVNGQISNQISAAMSPEAAEQVEKIVANATEEKKSILATIIGFITLVFGATGVLVQLQKSLNNIWEVKLDPEKQAWWHTVQSRLFSLGIIITLGFLLLVSMAVTTTLTALSDWMMERYPDALAYSVEALNFLISLVVITLLFALMFRILPDAKIKWKYLFAGGFLTTLFFIIGKFALGFYFGKSEPTSVYGAAGSIVLILLWVSYSSMILFFGAEFTKALVLNTGGKVVPKKNAIHVPGLNESIIKANSNDGRTSKSVKPESGLHQKKSSFNVKGFNYSADNGSFRRWLKMLGLFWFPVSMLFLIFPFLLKFIVNKILGKIENAEAKVESIRLSVIRPACTIKGLRFNNLGAAENQTLNFSAAILNFSFNLKALWKGMLVCEATADGLSFDFTRHKKPENNEQLKLAAIHGFHAHVPVIVKQVNIANSKIGFTDMSLTPVTNIIVDDIRISINNVSMLPSNELLPAKASIRANVYDGLLTAHLKANITERNPTFDLDAELIAVNMVKLNDFFKAYGNFNVSKGNLSFFTEIASQSGHYKGYVKPVIRNLDIVGLEDKRENIMNEIWQSAVGAAASIIKNQREDQLASKVPFEGKFKPDINVAYAVMETFVNAFVHALKPSIDYEININSVRK